MRKWLGVLAFVLLVAVVAIFGNMGGNETTEQPDKVEAEESTFDQAEFDDDMLTIRQVLRVAHDEGMRVLTTEELDGITNYTTQKYEGVIKPGDDNYTELTAHFDTYLEYRQATMGGSGGTTDYLEMLNDLDANYN